MKKKAFVLSIAFFLVFVIYGTYSLFFNNKHSSCIPVTMGSADTPLAHVEIQGKKYLLEVDLGSKFQLTLNKDVLNNLEKTPYGTLEGRDAKGNTYSSPAYLIQKIQIGNHIFNNVIVKEVNEDYLVNTTLFTFKTDEEEISNGKFGVVGRALLEKMNLLLDFQNSVILECNDITNLKQAGYQFEDLVMVPFEMGRTGAILTINTDWGEVRLSIDTGSTLSLIKSSFFKEAASAKQEYGMSCVNTSKFVVGSQDFGNMNLYLFDITHELHEIDGILGMDFLKNHVIYINYKDKVVYFGNSKAIPNK